MADQTKIAQMMRAAELYYEQNLSQQKIAKMLNCSHSTVSRLLAEARDTGVVQISIRRSVDSVSELSTEMREVFGLRDAVIVRESGTDELNLKNVGLAAANFLLSVIGDHMKIGITWGNTLHHMITAIGRSEMDGVEVIQLSGSLGQGNPEVDGPQLATRLAEQLGGICRLVPAPAVVDSASIRDSLIEQPQIKQALDLARTADIMIQGIGGMDAAISSLERAGYMTDVERKAAEAAGAVGHVFARMIDINGQEVGNYADRVIAIPLETMRHAMWSIGISASAKKVPAILGALRGNYFNAVVLEETSAREVLRLETSN